MLQLAIEGWRLTYCLLAKIKVFLDVQIQVSWDGHLRVYG